MLGDLKSSRYNPCVMAYGHCMAANRPFENPRRQVGMLPMPSTWTCRNGQNPHAEMQRQISEEYLM